MKTIGELCKQYQLSRATLLHYEEAGLLFPTSRSPGNYRLYNVDAENTLKQIILYRQTGMGLSAIKQLLGQTEDKSKTSQLLSERVAFINQQIQELRQQQRQLIALMENESIRDRASTESRQLTKQEWVNILSASGMDEEAMMNWHRAFEAQMPESHQDFLESLGIDDEEIALIRQRSGKIS